MTEELKPCPFCGDTPGPYRHRADEHQGYKWGSVVCSCGVVGPEVRTRYKETAQWGADADAEWNRRA